MKNALISVIALSFLSFSACDASVNRSRSLGDGERSAGMSSVNGSIRIGADCDVNGGCHTVNGGIEVGNGSRVEDLETVNGRIVIGTGVEVRGDAQTVNGSFRAAAGSVVLGQVTTVNGRIELTNAVVDRDVSTVNGDVRLNDRSVIRGSIVIKGRRGIFFGGKHLEVRIEEGSVVEGGIDVRDPERRVRVYLGKDSQVKGRITNAKVIKE